jgi:hypothetical protein
LKKIPGDNSAAVFDRLGLGSPGMWGAARISHGEGGIDSVAKGLRDALEQLGGLYAAFGRFLGWRADLLGATYINTLRHFPIDIPAVPLAAVAEMISLQVGPAAGELTANLEPDPEWNTLFRTAYRSRFAGRRVIVQVARDLVTSESFAQFEKGLRSLGRPEVASIVAPAVVAQFGEWLRNGESLARERSFLNVLGHEAETLAGYPQLIPELCGASVLCWPMVEGRPAAELLQSGDANIAVLIASAILEQFYSLSVVDAELDLDSMLVGADQRLYFRRLNSPVSVLPSLINTGIQYCAAVVAGNAAVSAQKLVRLVVSQPPLDLERLLMDEFSAIEPELKVNMWYPPSAGAFENNWRALARLTIMRPLFLNCLHRNLVALGYWNSEAERAGGPRLDAISEAQWPVVGGLLRSHIGMLSNRKSAEEWAVGSGLLLFSAFREMNRLTEEFRDNDLTVGVDIEESIAGAASGIRLSHAGLLAVFLCILFAGLRWGGAVQGPWNRVLEILAVGSLPGMFWALSRIG